MSKFKVGQRVHNNKEGYFCKILDIKESTGGYLVENEKGELIFTHIRRLHETADDMFEKLDYKNQGGNEWHNNKKNKNIYFDCDKTVSCYSYHAKLPTTRPEEMNMEEFKASYQMCIEKGWL